MLDSLIDLIQGCPQLFFILDAPKEYTQSNAELASPPREGS